MGGRTVFRHVVSNLGDVLAAIGSREWPLAAIYAHARVDQLRIRRADPLPSGGRGNGPADNPIPATSGVTLYRVKNRVIDDGEFMPLR